jgi:mono/diheme cytochrome c family protein
MPMPYKEIITSFIVCIAAAALFDPLSTLAADAEVLRPRVPVDQRDIAKAIFNPLSSNAELLEKGKALYQGKAFCIACHGREGKGLGADLALKGALPRDFTDATWQTSRSDGELYWILKNGSPGTDMAPFIPLVLTEEEAWEVLLYVRSFKGQ